MHRHLQEAHELSLNHFDLALTSDLDSRENKIAACKVGRRRVRDADSVRVVRVVPCIEHKVRAADDTVNRELCVHRPVAEPVTPVYGEFLRN
jgi:hypothetical protein